MSRAGSTTAVIGQLDTLIRRVYHRRVVRGNERAHSTGASGKALKEVLDMSLVRLLPGHQPGNEVELHLYAALAGGPLPLRALIDRVAEDLFRAELSRGGWVTDIGVWGPAIYRSEVASRVRMLEGWALVVETPSAQAGAGSADVVSAPGNGDTRLH